MKRHIPLLIILSLAIFFRFYHLDSVPPSPSLDEVSIGYNAYSIGKTGADEYGTRFPLLLRAYDDWRPALYVYTVIPFVEIFGLSARSVRLPSVIFSTLTVLFTYLLARELFSGDRYRWRVRGIAFDVATVASLLLAISPWHVYISRLGHEVNIGLSFVIFGLYFFVKATIVKQRVWSVPLSAIFLGLSFYAYQSQKIIVPLLVITLVLMYRKELVSMRRASLLSAALGIVIVLPLVKASLSSDAMVRFKGTVAFSPENARMVQSANKWFEAKQSGDIVGQLKYHRFVAAAQIFGEGYLLHFQPKWLFTGEASEQHKAPYVGLLYWWEAPLILLGMIVLIVGDIDRRVKMFLFVWFFSSPLPAAIANQTPHAMRTYTFLPTWQIFAGIGMLTLMRVGAGRVAKIAAFSVFLVAILLSSGYLFVRYMYDFPRIHSSSFQYALADAIDFVRLHQFSYENIIFSNEKNLYRSYMFYLFYTAYDPREYQAMGGTKSGGFTATHRIGTIEFRPIDWKSDNRLTHALLIGNPSDFPDDAQTIASAKNLDGEVAVNIVRR